MNEVLENMLNAGLDNAIQEAASNDAVQNAVVDAVGAVASATLEDRLNNLEDRLNNLADIHEGDFNLIKGRVCEIDNRIDGLEATRVTTDDVVKIAGVTALIAIPVGIGAAYAIKKWVAPKAKEWFAKKPEKAKVVADVEANVIEEE